jgi:hypothetical protein
MLFLPARLLAEAIPDLGIGLFEGGGCEHGGRKRADFTSSAKQSPVSGILPLTATAFGYIVRLDQSV